jgi:hypothetical protein
VRAVRPRGTHPEREVLPLSPSASPLRAKARSPVSDTMYSTPAAPRVISVFGVQVGQESINSWAPSSKSSYSHQGDTREASRTLTKRVPYIHTHTHLHTQPEATRMQHPSAHSHTRNQPNQTAQPALLQTRRAAQPCHQRLLHRGEWSVAMWSCMCMFCRRRERD